MLASVVQFIIGILCTTILYRKQIVGVGDPLLVPGIALIFMWTVNHICPLNKPKEQLTHGKFYKSRDASGIFSLNLKNHTQPTVFLKLADNFVQILTVTVAW